MANFDVRSATAEDVEPLTTLWQTIMQERAEMDFRLRLADNATETWKYELTKWLEQDDVRVLVADRAGQLIGYVIGWILERPTFVLHRRYGFISDLGVDGHAHQGGIGKALFSAITPWFQEQKVQHLEIQVMHRHPIAQAFWRASGAKDYLDVFWIRLNGQTNR